MGCNVLLCLVLSVTVPQMKVSYADSCVVDEPPKFTSNGQPPRAVLVDLQMDGNNLVLPCEVTGTPNITVSWFRGDTRISQTILEDGERDCTLSIRVTEAEAPREGTNYYCTVTNRIGPVVEPESRTIATLKSRDVNVSSSFFGGFQSREAEVATVEGGEVALECAFNPSNPAPNITWFANNVMITATSGIQFLEGGRYLYIRSLTSSERGMRYHCEVNNFRDENGMPIIAPTNYSLTRDIPVDTIHPYINQSTMSGRIGDVIMFAFPAAARRTSGTRVVVTTDCLDNNFLIFRQLTTSFITATLTEAARNENRVDFICELFSSPPSINVAGTILIISDPSPPNIADPAINDSSLVDRERQVGGGEVSYLCEASSSSITWYYNGAEVQSGSNGVDVSSDSTRLTIREPQFSHSGIFQCFARNQFGEDSRAWILEVADPAIKKVTFYSKYEIAEKSQGYFLLAPNATTNLVITATVNFTRVGAICDFYPQVQWRFNGTNITNGSDYTVSSDECTSPCTFTLTIANLTTDTSGNYSVVFTLLGAVRESPGLFITSSCISAITSIVQVEEPAYLEVHCRFFDIFPTTVLWFQSDTILSNTERIDILTVINGVSILRISSVVVKNGDVYTCTTRSECGSDSKDITIDTLKSGYGGSEDSSRRLVGGIVAAVASVLVVVAVRLFW